MQHFCLRLFIVTLFSLMTFVGDGQYVRIELSSQTPLCENEQWCTTVHLECDGYSLHLIDSSLIGTIEFDLTWENSLLQFNRLELDNGNIWYNPLSEDNFSITEEKLSFQWQDNLNPFLLLCEEMTNPLFDICWDVVEQGEGTFISQINNLKSSEGDNIDYPDFRYTAIRNPNKPTVKLEDIEISLLHSEFCIPVIAEGFSLATAATFQVNWDSNVFAYKGIDLGKSDFDGLTMDDFTIDTTGQIGVYWNALNNIPLDSDSWDEGRFIFQSRLMYELCFDILTEEALTSSIALDISAPVYIDNACGTQQTLEVSDIDVNVLEDGTTISFPDTIISSETGLLCIPTKINSLEKVIGIQMPLTWDNTILKLNSIDVTNSILPGVSEANFSNIDNSAELLIFSWVDWNLIGLDISRTSNIFETCFDVVGEVGSDSPLEITGSDIEIIYETDEIGNTIAQAGSVRIREEGYFVFPGDANEDKTTNHLDLLHIGLAHGKQGTSREDKSIDWKRKYSRNWSEESPLSKVNYKHSDTNGDDHVDAMDVAAIHENWGKSIDLEGNTYTPTDFANNSSMSIGITPLDAEQEIYELPILLGIDDVPLETAYGLAFSLSYEADFPMSNEDDWQIHIENSWLGTIDQDLIVIQRHFPENKRIDIAITRIDGMNRSGSGVVGSLHLNMQDVLTAIADEAHLSNIGLYIHDVRLINSAEEAILITDYELDLDLKSLINTDVEFLQKQEFSLFPNPARDIIQIIGEPNIERLTVTTLTGELVKNNEQVNNNRLNVVGLNAGIYFITVYTGSGIWIQRFVIL